ncbi:hypothetical protein BWQ96_08244 [Gracilariopsis chorda]|uniref:Putative restriction endonuclease domain-containing protein n=1 Tax=Gracilariopsis chorda TaxID=448386 RepID=A0A2V3IIW8_9FLOR|nr:hypothetical protein BWQ96_08244 [Gracilariopsis chorda]|eukprot:PXF42036.1 hypothetical protein BWQ96_08244 [Gracilariopsis chorda]
MNSTPSFSRVLTWSNTSVSIPWHSFKSFVTPPQQSSLLPPSAARIALVNFVSCSLLQFSQVLQTIDDRFELIDGILRYRQVPAPSQTIRRVTANKLELSNDSRNPSTGSPLPVDTAVAYSPSANSPISSNSSRGDGESCVAADMSVGPHISSDQLGNLSPNPRVIHYPVNKWPPFLVIEITSTNRINDIVFRAKLYAQIEIPEYAIIDRQRECVIAQKLNPSTHDIGGRRPRASPRLSDANEHSRLHSFIQKCIYSGNELVEASYLSDLGLTAIELLKPTRYSAEVAHS